MLPRPVLVRVAAMGMADAGVTSKILTWLTESVPQQRSGDAGQVYPRGTTVQKRHAWDFRV